jgi:hypothetical protein
MKNLKLDEMDIQKMDVQELEEVKGGVNVAAALAAGAGQIQGSLGGGFGPGYTWYAEFGQYFSY